MNGVFRCLAADLHGIVWECFSIFWYIVTCLAHIDTNRLESSIFKSVSKPREPKVGELLIWQGSFPEGPKVGTSLVCLGKSRKAGDWSKERKVGGRELACRDPEAGLLPAEVELVS